MRSEWSKKIRVAILTMSDKGSMGERKDSSGEIIKEMVNIISGEVVFYEVIPDEKEMIKERLIRISDADMADLILTTGGTGLSPRDVTPDATMEVIDREIAGIAEAMRMDGLKKSPRAMLSRAVAGIRKQCLIVNLPGSPKGVRENLTVILPAITHAIDKIRGDTTECGSI